MATGPLTREIAASTEEVQALLRDNRSLSIAHLANLLRNLEDDTAKSLLSVRAEVAAVQRELREELKKLNGRLDDLGRLNANYLKRLQPQNGKTA